jgi:hypothetical protein
MANASLGTLAISMTLWAADLGASHMQKPMPPADVAPATVVAAPATKSCDAAATTPADSDSDLEVVVCAKPIAR